MESIEFFETTFYKGFDATYGKVPVKLELFFDYKNSQSMDEENVHFLYVEIYAGIDKLYKITDIGRFVEAAFGRETYYLSKNFILEPSKMYFEKENRNVLGYFLELKNIRGNLKTSTIGLDKAEVEKFLDAIWQDIGFLKFLRGSPKFSFMQDINIKASIEKNKDCYLLTFDYAQYGHFEWISVNFRYIIFKDENMVVKLPENKMDVYKNIYNFQNDKKQVVFKIGSAEKKLFMKNFFDKYADEFNIIPDKELEKEFKKNRLVSKVYFDRAQVGIASKVEFEYDGKIINPLDEKILLKGFRDLDAERIVMDEVRNYGFKKMGKLFYLEDTEKIMFLLTDKLSVLKKVAEIYYSEDFKKLNVKNLDKIGLSMSEDGSIIHMNINLENVSDEELIEIIEAINTGKKYYRLKNGSIINLASMESKDFADLIKSIGINKDDVKDGIFEIPLNRCIYIDNYLKEKGIENVSMDARLGNLINDISNPQDFELVINERLTGILRNYQVLGVKWLKSMSRYCFGGILADDMGLGKTLQVLAFIESEKERKLPCMVIAPTSLIYNWKAESARFTPKLKILVISGSKDKRSGLIECMNDFDMVITSYGTLKNDINEYKSVKFSYIFVDEAQNIKNPVTLNANSVKSLQARCCFALTGTPIENRLTEIWSIFDFIMPGYLYARTKFQSMYEDPIMIEKDKGKMQELSKLTKPFIIRRLKKDVLEELPDKIETNCICEMTEKQKKLYMAYYKDLKDEWIDNKEEGEIEKNRMQIFTAMTRLRQICAHPSTFVEEYDGGSGKLEMAMEIITNAIASGHSVLLFSQFTKMLKIIENELISNGVSYHYLDGKMTAEERVATIEDFNSDKEAIFLISLKAGGTGLNLTKADIVIHFDPWWNPAVEDQASDRAYRMGQKNVVYVYKLVTEGTIEEKIIELQGKKKDLIDSIITPGEIFLNSLSEREIRELF